MCSIYQFIVLFVSFQWFPIIYAMDMNTDLILIRTQYCLAHQQCFRLGRSKQMIGYMVGEQLIDFNARNKIASDLWINLHILLEQTNKFGLNKWIYGENWSDTAPRRIEESKELQLNRGDRVAIYTKHGKILRANTAHREHEFVCSYSPVEVNKFVIRREIFRRQNVSYSKMYAFSDDTKGCYKSHFIFTRIKCALR